MNAAALGLPVTGLAGWGHRVFDGSLDAPFGVWEKAEPFGSSTKWAR